MIEIVPFYLILSMFVAFSVLYLISPKPKIIIKQPNINDSVSGLYVDDNKVCYRYKRTEIKCQIDKKNVEKII